MFTLENQIALVTGAGSGIGAAIAEIFAEAKAHVFVTDKDQPSGHETVARIKARSAQAEFLSLDVSNEDQCRQVAAYVHGAKGDLDILVNNAGIGHGGRM